MARLPPSCHAVHRGLRIPDLRAGDDSPLRTSHHHAVPATCRSRRLPTQRLRPCGLNATSRTQSRPCADISSSRSSRPCHDVHVVRRRSTEKRGAELCDAVVLVRISHTRCGLRRFKKPTGQEPRAARCGTSGKRGDAPCRLLQPALCVAFRRPSPPPPRPTLSPPPLIPPPPSTCLPPPGTQTP